MLTARYPTPQHENAASAIISFFAHRDDAETVLLVNSCARGKATPDSCLDIIVLVRPGTDTVPLDTVWRHYHANDPVFAALRATGAFSIVHLDVEDVRLEPALPAVDDYPDDAEIVIGNYLAYAVPLWERGGYFAQLVEQWLPYYDESLRLQRLAHVRRYCEDELAHIPLYVERGLYFQSFARLWSAFRMFLQALFIQRRTYPIACDKWIHEQVVDILGLPEVYEQLPRLFEIERFESDELVGKARDLQRLLDTFVPMG